MDILQLPSLPPVTPIKEAWSVLHTSQRSALITTLDGEPCLITAQELAAGENRGIERLADLEAHPVPVVDKERGRAGPPLPTLDALKNEGVDTHMLETRLGRPHHEIHPDAELQGVVDRILHGIDANFALIGMAPGSAILVSRFESVVRDHAGPPRACYCENPDYPHDFDDKTTGDPCDYDEYNVRCRR